MRKNIFAIILAAVILATAGCSDSATSSDSSVSTAESSSDSVSDVDYSGQTLYGKVTVISGSSVTVTLGELTETDMSGMGGGQGGETPPDVPSGEQGEQGGETPPDAPSGEQGEQGGMSMSSFTEGTDTAVFDLTDASVTIEQSGAEGSVSDIQLNDVLEIIVGDDNSVESVTVKSVMSGGMGGGFGGSSEVTQGTAAATIDTDGDYSGTSYTSTGDDENALRVDGAVVTLDNITVDKSGGSSSNAENGDFYGVNAAILVTNGAEATITDSVITSSAQNGNGVFSYGTGTVVNISDCTITTTADNSGGIQTTGGGTTNASNLTVETSGSSAAAIRSDRGGGTVNVDGGTYTSNGYNSPAVYSTAEITVRNAELTANNSEALVIEGKNSITLENCDVSGNMSDTRGSSSNINVHNIMIYQSMSGDADVGTSTFSMTGGTLVSENGDMIYVTNTHAVIYLSGVDISNLDADGNFLTVKGNDASNGWGSAGSNGAQVEFTADAQEISGDIVVDTISTLDITFSNGSIFSGTINIVDNAEGGAAVSDNAAVTVDAGCTWTLTGDCVITSLTNNGTINFNGYTITLADGTILS